MRKRRKAFAKDSVGAVLCWLALVMTVCVAVKVLSATELGTKIEAAVKNAVQAEGFAEKVLQLELGSPLEDTIIYKAVSALRSEQPQQETAEPEDTVAGEHDAESAVPQYDDAGESEVAQKTEKLDYTEDNIFNGEHLDASGIMLDNDAGLQIDTEKLLNSPLNFTVSQGEPVVLIVHTHGSEAYTPAGDDMYTESDPYRTEDNNYNVVRVGEELKKELESYGISVIHDTSLHDYPSYNGSYNRSFETIAEYIEKYPSIKIVIDLHRDAIANSDGTQYKTVAKIGDEVCSQLLFVMGTNASGLNHPKWQENMKLALKLQYAMNTLYPGLAKPINVSQYRYNQHMTTGSMILEVGCTGNTLQESLASMKYFAEALYQVLVNVTVKEN